MNNTNRAPNRTLLLVIGLLLLGLGTLGVTIVTWPSAADVWAQAGEGSGSWMQQASETTRIAGSGVTWIAVGAVAAIIVVIALLVLALVSVSGRRSKTVVRSTGSQNPLGRVTVTEGFVSDALTTSLSARDDILATHVTANDIRHEPVLHVAVTPRQNTDPRVLVDQIDQLLRNLSTLTGQETSAYVSVHAGLRARLAPDQRRLP